MLTPLFLALAVFSNDKPMLFGGLGPHYRHVSTRSTLAERYFNQGLEFMYGFNKGEALRSFKEAARIDPNCPMAYWGIAMANGPDINMPAVDPEHANAAWQAVLKAKATRSRGSAVERALVDAISTRFANRQPADRSGLDRAFADAMRKVWHQFPRDADVGALFAESLMDLRPWNQWKPDGTPQPGTMEVIETCRKVLRIEPNQPQALHMYIHASEGSPHPEWARDAANRLRLLQPTLGHMVHMPSHTDVRTGDWAKAIEANRRALDADYAYRSKRGLLDTYRFYVAHNWEMMGYAAMMVGRSKQSISAMESMLSPFHKDQLKAMAPFVDGYAAMPLEARVRFGMWDAVLASPEYPEYFPLANAIRHYARGVAYAAKGQVSEAKGEQDSFELSAAAVPEGYQFGTNSAKPILELCRHMLAGEIMLADGKLDGSVDELRSAVAAEDSLRYNEPPDWVMPVRHALGAVLVKASRYAEAEKVYREDLRRLPRNGWSLFGLAKSLEGQGRASEAVKVRGEFASIWKGADTPIESSCMCVSSKK